MSKIDTDRPISGVVDDEFGFSDTAGKLASSIADLTKSEGMVFGIEGQWGSGKSSFLNFLRLAIATHHPQIHVITLSPWLTGDASSLVGSLMAEVSPLLDRLERDKGGETDGRAKQRVADTAEALRKYALRTSRNLTPIAQFAGLFLPAAAIIKEGLEIASGTLDRLGAEPTETALKQQIISRIIALEAQFVVMIDDLDRLEPAQALEVVRLVRSVADFPNFVYVLCYDRAVLAHAIKLGLNVIDGDQYLQKIVQLAYTLPMPEPFDLRISFRTKVLALYEEVYGVPLGGDELDDLNSSIDSEGGRLSTPREVKLAFNNLAFVLKSIKEDIYFPDLCRVSLMKVLRPALYVWVQDYLAVRSLLVSGDARVDDDERRKLGEQMLALVSPNDPKSMQIWKMREYLPGIAAKSDPKDMVFDTVSAREMRSAIEKKRLGSPVHQRHYFALQGSKAMLATAEMLKLRKLARDDVDELAKILTRYILEPRPVGKSWFSHVIARLDENELANYSTEELSGLVKAFGRVAGVALRNLWRRGAMFSITDELGELMKSALRRIKFSDIRIFDSTVGTLLTTADISWLVSSFVRQAAFDNGLVGNQAIPADARILSDEQIERAKTILSSRLEEERQKLMPVPNLAAFLFGWLDLLGLEGPKKWVKEIAESDSGLVEILDGLRSWAMSSYVYYPLSKRNISTFLNFETVEARLGVIEVSGSVELQRRVADIRVALSQGRDEL